MVTVTVVQLKSAMVSFFGQHVNTYQSEVKCHLILTSWMSTLVMEGRDDYSRPGRLSKITGKVAPRQQCVS